MRSLVFGGVACVLLHVAPAVMAANLQCVFTPESVRIGIIGDPNFNTYVCSSSRCFNLGGYSDEKTKQFYAMSLSAISLGRKLNATYYGTSASDCETVSRAEAVFMLELMAD